jgi:hypothetical protein
MKFRKNLCLLVFLCWLLGIGWLASSQNCFAANVTGSTNTAPASSSISIGPFIGQESVKEHQSATGYEWVVTILDFTKNSLWPILVAVLVYVYRNAIKTFLEKKLPDLTSAKTPLGSFEFDKVIASQKMDTSDAEVKPLQTKINEKGVQEIITNFVKNVSKEFLRSSSWNGLKILYLCTECHKKKLAFDLKQVCASDGSMSYDYAFGYIVASCSAQFLRYETPDNINIKIILVHGDVQDEVMSAIGARLEFVSKTQGKEVANDFKSQLDKIVNYIASLESSKS